MRKFKCIKSYKSGEWLTEGKFYYQLEDGSMIFDDGYVLTDWDFKWSITPNKPYSDFLVEVTEEIKQEKEINMEFKVGDVVEILDGTEQCGWNDCEIMKKYIGTRGKITKIICDDSNQFRVSMELDNDFWFFNKEDLKLVTEESSSSQSFTITVSDTITTLKSADKTVEIKRYYTDKHDVKVAIDSVVKKYFDEIEEEEIVSKLPKVGDKVKVVHSGQTYDIYSEWLIENNASIKSAIKWSSGEIPSTKKVYEITLINNSHILIEDEYNAFIIDVEGLEVVK